MGLGLRRRGAPRVVIALLLLGLAAGVGVAQRSHPDSGVPVLRGSSATTLGSLLLDEGFEATTFPPDQWSYAAQSTPPSVWQRTEQPAQIYAGSGAAFIGWTDSDVPDELLFSPSLDLSAAANDVRLSFWYRTDPFWFTEGENNFACHVSADTGGTWTRIFSLHDLTDNGWAWRNAELDLSPWAGEPAVLLRWRFWGDESADLALDAIQVGSPVTEPAPNDDCAGAASGGFRISQPGTTSVSGDTRRGTHDYALTADGCTGFVQNGRDLVWLVDVPADHGMTAELEAHGDWDDALFVVGNCANPEASCLGGDRAVTGRSRVSFVNDATSTVLVYVVVAGIGDAAGEFTLHVSIETETSSPPSTWSRVKSAFRPRGQR